MYIPVETPVVLQGTFHCEFNVFDIILGFLIPQEIPIFINSHLFILKIFFKLVDNNKELFLC